MTYSADEFRNTRVLVQNTDVPLGTILWRRVDAALRIAERVMTEGLLEESVLSAFDGNLPSYKDEAAAIRKALTEDGQ